jgi:hypothetical protein
MLEINPSTIRVAGVFSIFYLGICDALAATSRQYSLNNAKKQHGKSTS